MATKELPILSFISVPLLEQWMSEYYAQSDGIWIKMAKKASGVASVNYNEALDVALCYGWIDGQRKGFDDTYFLQKFTRRRAKSLWSKRNIEIVGALTAAGKMQPSGLAEVTAAQADGRWQAAYDSPKNMVVPEDFLQTLGKNEKAQAFFSTLSKANLYAISLRLATAKKPETRQRRLEKILAMLERGEFR